MILSEDDKKIARSCGLSYAQAAAMIGDSQQQEAQEPRIHLSHRVREPQQDILSFPRRRSPGDQW
jgi:hypothetical protein